MATSDAPHTMAPRAPAGTPIDLAGAPIGVAGTAIELPEALVLYDGTCGFCARSVRWILDHERDHEIQFAPLQGPIAQRAREQFPRIPVSIDTVVYIAGGRAYLRSKAILYAARHLRAPWRWAYAMRWFPGFVLDLGYRVIAAVRYRIWGHADVCQMVTAAQRIRFLP
ncbi:MAG TPA: DCC1-like thiol-disulfide oxidoreductase family protein [Kofleriaceae bacterium]|nr:DCC1-like thiol-disulfide oxidoreductase family protein [Kofleriaceae bacterium]